MSKFLAALALMFVSVSTFALSLGEVAPNFTAKNQDGKIVHLADFKGKPVLLYFYPKDDTPGCTQEACSFRDEFQKFKDLGAVVIGVSRQNESSHKEFKAKHHLPFDLLADVDGSLAKAYGVGSYPVVGYNKRQSVLIGADGKVIHVYPDVDPGKHSAQVLQDLQDYAIHANKRSG